MTRAYVSPIDDVPVNPQWPRRPTLRIVRLAPVSGRRPMGPLPSPEGGAIIGRRGGSGRSTAHHGASSMARQDPLRNFRFRVEIDGLQVAGFSEVRIGATTTEVIDYREGSEPSHVRKLPGLHTFGNVTLKRGVTASLELFNWHQQILTGQTGAARRNVVIVVADDTGADQARFNVQDAWPARYEPSGLNGQGTEVFIETLELANEGIERAS
jgi:phage tail-like protein